LGEAWGRPGFTLRALDGTPFDFRARTGGQVTLLFFGYTHCPDVCPLHMANIAAVLAKMPPDDARKIDVVFVTTDPARDTPERVRTWLAQFNPRFIGLTGTRAQLDSAQLASKLLPAAADTTAKDTSYAVSHAAQVLAIAADDSVRLAYPFGTRQSDWAADLPRLLTAWTAAVLVKDPFMYAPVDDEAAIYATLVARRGWADTLTQLSASFARAGMLHGVTSPSGGMQRMTVLDRLPLRPGEAVALAPGGTLGMLTGLSSRAQPGDTVLVTWVFSGVGRRTVRVPVRRYGE
jgi:protein SCO1/2